MVRTAGGADDAASPGPMCRRDGGGRHDRPSDSAEYLRLEQSRRQSNIRPGSGHRRSRLQRAIVLSRARRPRGCRARTPRPASRPKRRSTSSRITTPATIVGARSGCRPGTSRRSRERQRGQPVAAARRSRVAVSTWPSTRVGVVGLELQVDRGARGRRCRRRRSRRATRARTAAGTAASSVARDVGARAPSSSSAVGGSRCRWRSVWRTTPTCVETWKSTSPRAPTTSSVEPPPMSITSSGVGRRSRARGRAEERQPRLLVAGQRARVEPERVAHASRRTRRRWRRRGRRRSSPRRARSRRARSIAAR